MGSKLFDILPAVGGGLFTSAQASPAGLNKPRWAKITDAVGETPTLYGWEEQTFQKLDPGSPNSIGFVKADAGITGTVNRNPIIEPNSRSLQVNDFVLVQAAYFDPDYDTVFIAIGGAAGGAGGFSFAKCVNGSPTGGRFDALLEDVAADGTISDSTTQIWLRDCNNVAGLVTNRIYECVLTGNTLGRPVYTTHAQGVNVVNYLPDGNLDAIFYNVSDIYVLSVPTAYDNTKGDYVMSWQDESIRALRIRLNGLTDNQDFLTRCVDGILKKRNLEFRNGLAKIMDDEADSGN